MKDFGLDIPSLVMGFLDSHLIVTSAEFWALPSGSFLLHTHYLFWKNEIV